MCIITLLVWQKHMFDSDQIDLLKKSSSIQTGFNLWFLLLTGSDETLQTCISINNTSARSSTIRLQPWVISRRPPCLIVILKDSLWCMFNESCTIIAVCDRDKLMHSMHSDMIHSLLSLYDFVPIFIFEEYTGCSFPYNQWWPELSWLKTWTSHNKSCMRCITSLRSHNFGRQTDNFNVKYDGCIMV